LDEDDIDSPDQPDRPVSPPWRINMGPLVRSLSAEPLALELARRRVAGEIKRAMTSAPLRIEDALANAFDDEWIEVDVVCKGLMREPVEVVVTQLAACKRIEVDQGRVRRGSAWRD
jgi:hypothetical protein